VSEADQVLPAGLRLISANDHVVEPSDLWTSRLPVSLAESGPRVVTRRGTQRWDLGTTSLAVADLGVPAVGSGTATHVEDMDVAAYEPSARLAAMDRDGVYATVLLPHVIGFAGERLRHLADGDLWTAAARVYNDYVLQEFCAVDGRRLFAAAILPLHDPDAAAAEVQRTAAAGARAITFPSDLGGLGLASLYSGRWDSVLDAAADTGLPLMIHIGSGPAPDGPVGRRLALASLDALAAAVDVVHAHVLLNRPRLQVVFVEGGAAWFPYLSERLDFFLKRDGVWPRDAIPPSELLARQCYATFIDDPSAIASRLTVGVDRMLWQSDFPHGDGFWPASRTHLAASLEGVSDADAEAVGAGNARRVFRLPVDP
jgi:predicted TIM-barrel fold metal-dependent hydrolase